VNSLPQTVTRQHRDYDLNPGPSAPESSTVTTRLPSHAQAWHVHVISVPPQGVGATLLLRDSGLLQLFTLNK